MSLNNLVAVSTDNERLTQKAADLARKLNIPLVDPTSTLYPFLLVYGEKRLQLQQIFSAGVSYQPGPVFTEFIAGRTGYRIRHGGGIKQHIARAVGVKEGVRPTVIDATAGLGRDGFLLASLGCRVFMVERSPVIAALLQDGLERACLDASVKAYVTNITVAVTDSLNEIAEIVRQNRVDTIYLDPMYPHRTKSSLVKKEMRLLRAIVGADEDCNALFAAALASPVKRVVVKRPRPAESMAGPQPSIVISGKSSRYDIYFPASIPGEPRK